MSTITYNNTVYTQVFIDPSKTVAGDGTTPENAFFDFPTTLADNTCYVIRRTNETPNTVPQIPNGTYDIKNLMICGMPKSTDLLYKYMNQTEKDAWGADEFDYAMCRVNNTTVDVPAVTFSAINDFIINRCYLFKDENSLTNYSYYEYMFDLTSTEANTKIDNCKFGYFGDNFEDSTWLAANTAPNKKYKLIFIRTKNAKSLTVSNSIFNVLGWGSSSGKPRIFNVEGLEKLNFVNNTFNACSYDSSGSLNPSTTFSVIFLYNCKNTNLDGNVFNIIDYADVTVPHFNLCYISPKEGQTTDVFFNNTKIRYKEMKDNVATAPSNGNGILFEIQNLTHYNITNFDLDFSNSHYFGNDQDLTITAYYSRSPNNKIDNISIKYNTSATVGYVNGDSYSSIAFISKQAIIADTYSTYLPIYTPSICKGTNITVLRGAGSALYSRGFCVEADVIRGLVYLDNQNYFKANKVTNPRGNYKVVYGPSSCCSTIAIDTLEVVKDNAAYPYDSSIEQMQFESNTNKYANNIFVNHSNALPFSLALSAGKNGYACDTSWVANDYNGLFIARNISASAKSWGVTRTGTTAQASFKLETTVNDVDNELTLGCNPCTGFLLTPTATGTKTITAYFGSSNTYNSFAGISSKIWLEAFVPQADGSFKVYNSITQGAIEQDTSVWEGDSGVKPLKVVLPVEVKTTDAIEVKVHFHWYDSIGYTYLDPELHLD